MKKNSGKYFDTGLMEILSKIMKGKFQWNAWKAKKWAFAHKKMQQFQQSDSFVYQMKYIWDLIANTKKKKKL